MTFDLDILVRLDPRSGSKVKVVDQSLRPRDEKDIHVLSTVHVTT